MYNCSGPMLFFSAKHLLFSDTSATLCLGEKCPCLSSPGSGPDALTLFSFLYSNSLWSGALTQRQQFGPSFSRHSREVP